jgi:hypothetical protein
VLVIFGLHVCMCARHIWTACGLKNVPRPAAPGVATVTAAPLYLAPHACRATPPGAARLPRHSQWRRTPRAGIPRGDRRVCCAASRCCRLCRATTHGAVDLPRHSQRHRTPQSGIASGDRRVRCAARRCCHLCRTTPPGIARCRAIARGAADLDQPRADTIWPLA